MTTKQGSTTPLLDEFAQHKAFCESNIRYPSPPCDCGLQNAINAYDSLRSEVKALREQLEKLAKRGHVDKPCPKSTAWYPEESTCTCGLDQLPGPTK